MKKILWLCLILLSCKHEQVTPIIPQDEEPKQYGVPFTNVPVPTDAVMYEVNIRAFSANGDFQGVIDRLDNIKALGVNTIWLMPIYPVGQINSAGGLGSPYSVQDYLGVNPEFGDLTKLHELVDKAHDKGMAVILDWVANHTSWDNKWIKNKSWYTQDASGNIISPAGTNWLDVADLNYDNADMRKAMMHVMKYWILEGNVDGFRCDAADLVPMDFWSQAIDTLKAIPNRQLILLAEGADPQEFSAGFQINYGWDFYNTLKSVYDGTQPASNIFFTHLSEYASIPFGARKLRFTTNHDISAGATPVQLLGGKSGALSASVITLFINPVPLLYGSQEVGRTSPIDIFIQSPTNWAANPDMEQAYEKLLTLYHSSPAFTAGSLSYFLDTNVAVFERSSGTDQFLMLVNTRNAAEDYNLDGSLMNTSWTDALNASPVSLGTTIHLDAYQYLILKH